MDFIDYSIGTVPNDNTGTNHRTIFGRIKTMLIELYAWADTVVTETFLAANYVPNTLTINGQTLTENLTIVEGSGDSFVSSGALTLNSATHNYTLPDKCKLYSIDIVRTAGSLSVTILKDSVELYTEVGIDSNYSIDMPIFGIGTTVTVVIVTTGFTGSFYKHIKQF